MPFKAIPRAVESISGGFLAKISPAQIILASFLLSISLGLAPLAQTPTGFPLRIVPSAGWGRGTLPGT